MTVMESATAGSLAGVLSMALTYPLDQLRTRLQAGEEQASILFDINTNGPSVLFRGLRSVLETVAASNYVYFYIFEDLKSRGVFSSLGADLQTLSFSTLAGVCNVLATEPLWKANTRLKLRSSSRSSSVFTETAASIEADGLLAQWSGTGASLLLVINPVVQFFVYENLKRRLLVRRKFLSASQAFLLGALAKAVATLVTYPLQVAQTRQRLETAEARGERRSVLAVLTAIARHEGASGLFRGLGAKLSQTVLTAAFMFLFYERIRAKTSRLLRLARPSVNK